MSKKSRRVSYKDWLTEDSLTKLESYARSGLTDKQIAINIGVAEGTLATWKGKYKQIAKALKNGKEVIDIQVENALFKRALGYEYEEIKTTIEDVDGDPRKRIEKTIRHIPADTTAQIFWLRNRKGLHWRNRDQVEVDKVLAETEFLKEKTRLIKGIEKDTSMMEVLIDVMGEDVGKKKPKTDKKKD